MNQFICKVTQIQRLENLSILSFDFEGQSLRMIALKVDESIEIGSRVILGVKATNVSLAKDFEGVLSISNQINSKVQEIDQGELLTSVKLRTNKTDIQSIISYKSSSDMNLQVGDDIKVLINESELSILEICS